MHYYAFGFGEGWQLSEADLTKSRGLRISLSRSPTAGHTATHKPSKASTLGPNPLNENDTSRESGSNRFYFIDASRFSSPAIRLSLR